MKMKSVDSSKLKTKSQYSPGSFLFYFEGFKRKKQWVYLSLLLPRFKRDS
ncbi:hypothetical protein HanRHA438_Chr15g0693141 [Helianthus annuus]|nr:hypothetical protein HanRHA438_Chr15g0693141 [Helianthus annuus]